MDSEGNLELFRQIAQGKLPEDKEPKQVIPLPEGEHTKYPWGDFWLSLYNDFLFEEI